MGELPLSIPTALSSVSLSDTESPTQALLHNVLRRPIWVTFKQAFGEMGAVCVSFLPSYVHPFCGMGAGIGNASATSYAHGGCPGALGR